MHQFSHVLIIDVPNGFLFQKNLKLSFQKAQEKCIQFSLNLSPRSLVDPSHLPLNGFRLMAKQNTVLRILFLSTGVEWRYIKGYIHKIFKPSPSTHSIRQKIGDTSAENKYRAKKLILLRAKNALVRVWDPISLRGSQ